MNKIKRFFKRPFFANAYPKYSWRFKLYYFFHHKESDELFLNFMDASIKASGGIPPNQVTKASIPPNQVSEKK